MTFIGAGSCVINANQAGNANYNAAPQVQQSFAVTDATPPIAPSGLSAITVSSTEITLAWTASTDNVAVTGYLVEQCQGAGCSSFVQIASPTTTNFNNTGLNAGNSYSYRVRATDAAGNVSEYSSIASTTTQAPDSTAPTAPTGLTATAVSATQIDLAWTAATDGVAVTGYWVEQCQGAGCSSFAQIATPTATGFNNTGLSAGTSYSYRVRATDAAGNLSAYSSVATSSTPLGLAAAYAFNEGAGTTVADTSGNNNTGTLSGATWTAAGQFSNALGFNGSSASVDLGNPATLQLTGSVTISAWIKAAAFADADAAIVSKRTGSTNQGFELDTTVDTGPRAIGFKLTDASGALMSRIGATTLQVNQWYYVSGVYDAGAQTLDVYLNGVLDNGALTGTVTATQQNSPLNVSIGQRPGAAGYGFNGIIDEVRIYHRALTQAEIQADKATPLDGTPLPPDTTPPSAPSGLSAIAGNGAEITLAWTAASDNVGVTGYQVERCQGAGCTSFAQIAAPAITSFNDSGLVTSTSYSYQVRAVDAAGNLGPYSNMASATTLDSIPPSAPTGLTANAVSSTQINLAWTVVTDDVGVIGYRLERCQGAGCTSFAQIATPAATSFIDTGLVASTSYSYRVLAFDAAGNLSAYSNAVSVTTPAVSGTLATRFDFNFDGKSDILWRESATGLNAIWQMDGTTLAGSALIPSVSAPGWTIAGQGDFNGDGRADILWRNTVTGDNAIWLMNGFTLASGALIPSVPITWSIAGVGDFDGDGKADILWRDSSGQNAIWLMNGTTLASSSLITGVPTSWAISGVGDFDGDGKADILWRDGSTESNAIWLMNGTALAASALIASVPATWSIAGVGDYDGDGKTDILWRNTESGDNAIWLMNGTALASSALIVSVPTAWSIVGVGDYDGDGKADILWRDSTGQNAIWLMNRTSIVTGALLPGVPTSWGVSLGR